MWRNFLSLAVFAISCPLFADASTERTFAKIAQNRHDIKQQMIASQFQQKDETATNSSNGFRFLNKNTTKFQVKSMPLVPYDLGEMYAGNIPISKNDSSRSLFFIFQPTIGKPVDEVTIWLNGGPGCSSMDGFFQEAGRFLWQPGVFQPQVNPYSWVNETNMLWVDQPVGTGYTTGKPRATTEEEIAKEFGDFFRNFEETFGIKKFKIFVTGESYAGRYISYISAEMLNRKNPDYFNLKGALIYDGVIGAFTYTQYTVPLVPLVQANANLFNFNDTFMRQIEGLHRTCGYKAVYDKYLTFPPPGRQPPAPDVSDACDVFDLVNNAALQVNPCFDIYSINQQCPLLWDVKGFPTELVFEYPGFEVYFNRTDVKRALHAPVNQSWAECQGPVFVGRGGPEGEGDLSADPIQKVLPQVIEGTNRTLVANGDWDMIIITNGTLLAIQNMTWNGKLGFQQRPTTPIDIRLPDLQYQQVFADNGAPGVDGPQGIMGTQHFERGLMFASTRQCGHMQPEFQPRVAYRHIQWVLGRIETI